jgi:acetylornithine deacetylase
MVDVASLPWADVDAAIAANAASALEFLGRLIKVKSTVGAEAPAQEVVAGELDRLGFEVTRLPIPEQTAERAPAGVAQASYAGRTNVWGRINPGRSPSLLLNGHVDVVPAEDDLWASDPFMPQLQDGWMTGRGAGDMKGGLAMGLLAISALRDAAGNRNGADLISGELGFLSVIEEECTGNGTLAAANAGALGDAVVLLEPTNQEVLLGGVGVLWLEIGLAGIPAHAEAADRAVNPIKSIPVILDALSRLETHMRDSVADPAFSGVQSPYNINVGTVRAGDWASSVPGRAAMRVRVGFPRAWTPAQALDQVTAAIEAAAAADPWLSGHPPTIREIGFRAEGFLLRPDHPLAEAIARAHEMAHGTPPPSGVLGATMDARYYLNQFGRPALAYGPTARNIHAADEAVEIASIVAGARTLARFIAGYFAAGGLPQLADGATVPPGERDWVADREAPV